MLSPLYSLRTFCHRLVKIRTRFVTKLCLQEFVLAKHNICFEMLQFIEKLRDIWVPPNEEQFLDTGYIVIGPIPREKDFHLTSRKFPK